jgi:hypothetical protein
MVAAETEVSVRGCKGNNAAALHLIAAAGKDASRKASEGDTCLRSRRRDNRKRMNTATRQETMMKPEMLNKGRCSARSEWLTATRMLFVKESEWMSGEGGEV